MAVLTEAMSAISFRGAGAALVPLGPSPLMRTYADVFPSLPKVGNGSPPPETVVRAVSPRTTENPRVVQPHPEFWAEGVPGRPGTRLRKPPGLESANSFCALSYLTG